MKPGTIFSIGNCRYRVISSGLVTTYNRKGKAFEYVAVQVEAA